MPTVSSQEIALANARARLPMPADSGMDPGQWRVLVEAIFPSARSPDSIMLALNYCRARGLDPFKRPVHIVPVWNSALGREVETVWPSINELETTAARTGAWAGIDPPDFGPPETATFKGRRKVNGTWQDVEVSVTFPEWAAVRVYRMVNGVRCPFSEPVFWLESYGRVGASSLPNDQWARRPRGMITKVAKAASLRAAFPEETGYTAEEMEGSDQASPTPLPEPKWSGPQRPTEARTGPRGPSPASPPSEDPAPAPEAAHDPDYDPDTGEVGPRELPVRETPDGPAWRDFAIAFVAKVDTAHTIEEVGAWTEANAEPLTRLAQDGPKLHARLQAAVGRRLIALAPPEADAPPFDDEPEVEVEPDERPDEPAEEA